MLTSLEPWNVYDEHNDDSIFLATQVRTNVERAATAAAVATRCCLTAKKLQYPHTPPAPWAPTPSPVRLLVANFLPILIARSFLLLCTSCEASIASDFVGAYVAVVGWACGECIKCCCCRCCFCAAAATTSSSCSVCVLHCSVQFLRKVGGIKVFAIAPNFCKKNDKNGRISFSEVYSPFYRSSANQNEDTFSCEKNG